jgi:hypothetical protein
MPRYPAGGGGGGAVGVVTTGNFNLADNVLQQDCLIFVAADQKIEVELDLNTLTQINTIREYVQTDGVNYRQISARVFPNQFDNATKPVIITFTQKNSLYKITLQASVAEGAIRAIPYRYMLTAS